MTYLGHRIDESGFHPLTHKMKAIRDAPTPESLSKLKSYIVGMLTYYGKFLRNLSTILSPLYHLLRKDIHWNWGPDQDRAFKISKNMLTSDSYKK